MYLTIMYALLALICLYAAFHTTKVRRLGNIFLLIVCGSLSIWRCINKDHSVIYPPLDLKSIYEPLFSINLEQAALIFVIAAALTIISFVQIKKIRDR
jgi:hypothetical protein